MRDLSKTALGVIGAMLLCCAALSPAQTAPEMTPEGKQVLDSTIAALGGSTYLDVKSVTTIGKIFEIRGGKTAGMTDFRDFVVYPDKVRTEFGRKRQLIMINNRLQGWVVDNGIFHTQSAREVVGFLKSQQHDLDRTLRWRIFHEKCVITSGGQSLLDNVEVFKLNFEFPQVETMSLWVDASTKLPVKFSYRTENTTHSAPAAAEADKKSQDAQVEEEISYSSYRAIDGVKVPFHLLISRNGERSAEIFLTEVQVNHNLPESLFANPAASFRSQR